MDERQLPVLIDRQSLLTALRHLETIVVSLDRIGGCAGTSTQSEIDDMLIRFIYDWKIALKLAEARSLLLSCFSREIGEDDMDEVEREMADLEYWSYNQRTPCKS